MSKEIDKYERSVLPIHSVVGRFIEYLFRKLLIKCDKCKDGRVRHDHREQINSTWDRGV